MCGSTTQGLNRAFTCGVPDYVRLLKYGDSLYRCKELKRAAMVSGLNGRCCLEDDRCGHRALVHAMG